nr:cullin repeat-like-containing domain-containing protein [Tanacetum cinerariifolium]
MCTVAKYQNEFELLINQVTWIPQSLLIPFYISRLKLYLQRELNLVSRPTTLGNVFLLARIIEARFKDTNNQTDDSNGRDKKDHYMNDKQEVKKADDQEIKNVKDEERKNVKDQQVEKLPMESQLKNNFRKALEETMSKDLEKKMLDLNPTLHNPQKFVVDQKKKHYKTKYALKINDEEFRKAKSVTTIKIRKLAKEEYWILESREFSRHHLEDKVVVKDLIPAESDSLTHAHVQTTKTYYKYQDSRIKKAQELKIKTSANSDIKDTSLETKLRGRLLASFQDDAKYEHVGQDTRLQDGKNDQDKQGKDLKVSEQKTMTKAQDQRSHSMKEQAYNIIKTKIQELNDKAISTSLRKQDSRSRLRNSKTTC